MKRLSIGLRLTLWYVLIFAVAQAMFGVGMWLILRQNLYQIVNESLANQIDDLNNFLEAQKPDASVAKMQEEVSEAYLLEHSGDYLQILDASGDWIFRSDFLQKHRLSFSLSGNGAGHFDTIVDGKHFRFHAQSVRSHGRTYEVETGVVTDDVVHTLSLFRRFLLMFAPVLFLAAAALGNWLSRSALSPVDALSQAAETITAENLSRRLDPLETGDELARLTDTLNSMLARLQGAFQRVTQFTADASHELRTPIALIRTESELTLRRPRSETEYREALRHILLESERTTSLLEQLLALARADSGRELLRIQRLDFRRTVVESLEGWHQVAALRGLRFTAEIEEKDFELSGDESALRRVVNILLDNSFKYTPSGGFVGLSLEQNQGRAVLRVRDSGIGIPKEEQNRIFERFYRVDKARSRELGGAGLGLSIAQWIVQQHRGAITLESEADLGCVFAIELPLTASTPSMTVTV